MGYGGEDCGITKGITAARLKKGKTYKVTAWIYGERVKPATTGISGTPDHEAAVYFDFFTDVNDTSFPDNVLGNISSLTSLVQDEWTKVESYFVAQGSSHTLRINCPYYYDDKKYPDNYDIFYVDDVTFEEQTNADILHYTPNYDTYNKGQYMVNKRSYNRLNPDNEIKSGAKYIDLTETQRHIKLGETAELNASILTAVKGQKAGTITREKADNHISVETNEDFLTYKDGVFTPVNAGSTVAKITYNDGTFTDTRNLLVTVYADGAEMCDPETMDTWQYPTITDPIDKNNNIYVGTVKNYVNGYTLSAKTPVPANKHTVISYRSYFPGGDNDDTRMGGVTISAGKNSWIVNGGGGVPLYIQGTNFEQKRLDNDILTGWNNIDYVFEPVGENTSDVSIYVNGNFVKKASNVTMTEDSTFSCTVGGGTLIDDFKVVTVDLEPKVSEVKLPGEGETLSTLDDFDVTFASPMDVADGGIKLFDSENNEAAVRLFASDDKMTYTIRPDGGLKPETEYRLVFVPEMISLVSNSAIKLSASTPEYTFRTDSTIVSDITGKGYTLLNAQHDMIGNGNYKLGSTAQLIEETKELKASYVSQTENFPTPFTFNAEKSFVNDTQKGDRYVVEFDAKVDMEKPVENSKQLKEWFAVSAVDRNGKSSTISRPGTDPWGGNEFTLRYSTKAEPGYTAALYDTALVHDKVQLFGGYMHFKFVFEFGQDNEMGKIKQTFYLTDTTGKEYVYGPVYSCGGETGDLGADFDPVAINSVYWNSRQMANRDLSIKNVSIYSLKKSAEAENAVDVSEFIVLDENSNAAKSITAGNKYSVSCKVANNAYEGDSITVIAGIFNADNKLIAVKSAVTAAPKGTEDTITLDNLDLSNAAEDTYTLKVFCWNSLDAAVPLTDIYYPLAR